MKAVTCHEGRLTVAELPAPEPVKGQLVLDVLRAGICGSDLHARLHCDEVAEASSYAGYEGFMRSGDTVVMGHEFVGEVVDHGPRTSRAPKPGTRVVAMPLLRTGSEVHAVGLSPHAAGAYAEQMVVQSALAMPVPEGLPDEIAALTEPMAVALHAVRRGEVGKSRIAVVVGCGPIGLAVVLMLKASGVRTVIASDLSPGRRALAERCGADVVVDPGVESPWEAAQARGHYKDAADVFGLAVDSMEQLRAVPLLPWARVMHAAEALGAMPSGPVVFECVGVPGMLDHVLASVPLATRVVVVGVCMGSDAFRPSIAINKETELRFVLGYTPREFHETLHLMADGKVDPAPLVTGTVGLDGVAGAFEDLADPGDHAKILVDPRLA